MEGTFSYYASTLEKVDVACKQLSWGAQHPEVKKAIADLKEHASARDSDYVKLRDKARAFEAKVRSYRKLTMDDLQGKRDPKMPDVIGKTVDEAKKILADNGFTLVEVRTLSAPRKGCVPNRICATSPEAGVRAAPQVPKTIFLPPDEDAPPAGEATRSGNPDKPDKPQPDKPKDEPPAPIF